jgi:hypothetical protein
MTPATPATPATRHSTSVPKHLAPAVTAKNNKALAGFQALYQKAIDRHHKTMKPRKLTESLKRVVEQLMERNAEWGGGIDFEHDTHLPERIHAHRGTMHLDSTGQRVLGAAVEVDEGKGFQLRFHTHPYSSPFGAHKLPSESDLASVTLKAPHLISTRSENGKLLHVLVTSIHPDQKPPSFFQGIFTGNWWQNERELRRALNVVGFDFKRIDPSKEKIWMRKTRGRGHRRIIVKQRKERGLIS